MLLKLMVLLAEPVLLPCTVLGTSCPDIERVGALAGAIAWKKCRRAFGPLPRKLLALGCSHAAFVQVKARLPDAETPRQHRRFRLVKNASRVEHEGALAA
jgi:hypothetical protein